MGIVNASPDSFSGDGCAGSAQALDLALQHIANGADIIDIGGQSTRPAGFTGLPGYIPIDERVELERVLPIIIELRKHSDVIISVDTFSPYVLEKCLESGADILNSIWGLDIHRSGINLPMSSHTDLTTIVAKSKCPVVIMHNKNVAEYSNGVVSEVKDYLFQSAQQAIKSGISEDHIILDPGIGFGKTPAQSLELLSNLHELTQLGFPTLLGTSRKSVIGKLTGKTPEQRIYGTAATIALGIQSGIDIVRVHDVAQMLDCIKVADAIARKRSTEHQ
jgi:dihydropteroate synthase